MQVRLDSAPASVLAVPEVAVVTELADPAVTAVTFLHLAQVDQVVPPQTPVVLREDLAGLLVDLEIPVLVAPQALVLPQKDSAGLQTLEAQLEGRVHLEALLKPKNSRPATKNLITHLMEAAVNTPLALDPIQVLAAVRKEVLANPNQKSILPPVVSVPSMVIVENITSAQHLNLVLVAVRKEVLANPNQKSILLPVDSVPSMVIVENITSAHHLNLALVVARKEILAKSTQKNIAFQAEVCLIMPDPETVENTVLALVQALAVAMEEVSVKLTHRARLVEALDLVVVDSLRKAKRAHQAASEVEVREPNLKANNRILRVGDNGSQVASNLAQDRVDMEVQVPN
ncbi:hypothetical protein O3G_MSEX014707 [Manduca sexta]|uniref:Uncharacterized protein n=1 Tax=Manduca sexta TaxID=7130 RepID=A0A921ZWG6_MANSE|nr:hypothetical protein O3G_MSEX014707 [Manduca sexta]